MSIRSRITFKQICAFLLVVLTAYSHTALGNMQVVTQGQLHDAAMAASQARSSNMASVQQFLQSELGQTATRVARIDIAKIERGIATLDDPELARLAKQSQALQTDFAAGRLSNTHITYIIIAAVAIVLIIALAAD